MGRGTLAQLGVLGIYTETPLHCGAESGTGYVDQPVQRERHTGFPVIPGSSLKGVLRDEMRALWGKDDTRLIDTFGSEGQGAESPGCVSFGDGILVAFPVRSSGEPFHWVTAPMVLERLFRLLGLDFDINAPDEGTCWGPAEGEILLEELRLVGRPWPDFYDATGSGLPSLLALLPGHGDFTYTRSIFSDRLLVVGDGDFRELTETGTEILTRIKLTGLGTTTNLKDGEHEEITGADRQGNMFVQEVVPPDTLFVSPLRAHQPPADFVTALEALTTLRIGGDETVGRGITHPHLVTMVREEETA